jgi:predicted RNA-binding Zn ribbon-like protein
MSRQKVGLMVRSPFLFIAAALPLDFLNTEAMLNGQPADLLRDGDDLLRWVAESGLATKPETRLLRQAGASVRASWLKESHRLRAGLRAMFSRVAGGQPLRPSDLDRINEVLASSTATMRLEPGDPTPSLQLQANAVTPAFLVARATAEFLASADLTLVRRCQGDGCILFFYDTTKSHTRRWCSMATCGNRTKVKAHYVRRRDGE